MHTFLRFRLKAVFENRFKTDALCSSVRSRGFLSHIAAATRIPLQAYIMLKTWTGPRNDPELLTSFVRMWRSSNVFANICVTSIEHSMHAWFTYCIDRNWCAQQGDEILLTKSGSNAYMQSEIHAYTNIQTEEWIAEYFDTPEIVVPREDSQKKLAVVKATLECMQRNRTSPQSTTHAHVSVLDCVREQFPTVHASYVESLHKSVFQATKVPLEFDRILRENPSASNLELSNIILARSMSKYTHIKDLVPLISLWKRYCVASTKLSACRENNGEVTLSEESVDLMLNELIASTTLRMNGN